MKSKHSVGWHVAKNLTRKLKTQRAVILVLSVILAILSVWLCISGGK